MHDLRPTNPGTPRSGCLAQAGWFLAAVPLVCFALVCLPHCGERDTTAPPPVAGPASLVGRVGHLGTGDPMQGRPVLARDHPAYLAYLEVADAPADRFLEAREAMYLDGRIFAVPPRTRVVVMAEQGGAVEVQVLRGERFGHKGWIAAPWFRPE